MFNQTLFDRALAEFKRDFPGRQWPNEKYKWVAVKHCQDHWDVNASDFAGMLTRSLGKTFNLLGSMNNYPRRMMERLAQAAPEEARAMFIALYDETADVWERVAAFKQRAAALMDRLGLGSGQHYQNENAVTTYLWLRYPDRYYIYKLSEIRAANEALEGSYTFKRGDYASNIRNTLAFYDEICRALQGDAELAALFKARLTADCYPDPQFRTMTQTFGFYISRFYSADARVTPEEAWYHADYTPGLSVEDWAALLRDMTVFNETSLTIMKRLRDYGGAATCTQLAVKYGENANYYNTGSSALARRVAEKTGCPTLDRESEEFRWWPILYVGRMAGPREEGVFVWKLRDELAAALDGMDLTDIPLFAAVDEEERDTQYWWLNANPASGATPVSTSARFRTTPCTTKSVTSAASFRTFWTPGPGT